jgi:F-type H+-transporting ATPase subunit epsilon
MAANIQLEVVTPEKSVVSEEAQMVVAPGTEGEFGVLAGHTPFLSTLRLGTIRYQDAQGRERHVFVSGGFSETLPDKVTVLAEVAERRRDIDNQRAQAALQRAQERLDRKASEQVAVDFERAKIALERALYRIRVAGTIDS